MGVIVNPRGASGSGKTELVRRVMAEYGWTRVGRFESGATVEPIEIAGRTKPFGYRLPHPRGGRPLVVIGHYERTSGGGDTIRMADGGTEAIIRCARERAEMGCDVVVEGLRLSHEHQLSQALGRSHQLHVLCLCSPVEECVRNLIARRRAGRSAWASIATTVETEQRAIDEACRRLAGIAVVEVLGFDAAYARARDLLGLQHRSATVVLKRAAEAAPLPDPGWVPVPAER